VPNLCQSFPGFDAAAAAPSPSQVTLDTESLALWMNGSTVVAVERLHSVPAELVHDPNGPLVDAILVVLVRKPTPAC
jgi:hypothetical protein